jgi:hypothetical protein
MYTKQKSFPFLLTLFGVLFGTAISSFAAPGLLSDNGGANSHPHNLSSTSTAAIHSNTEDRICVFCHAPHGSSAKGPLWNRNDPLGPNGDGTFPLYANAEPGLLANADADYDNSDPDLYPNGSTRLCLSCHDGVTAIAEVINGGDLDPAMGNMTTEGSTKIIDLSAAHPVSFVFNQTIADAIYNDSPDVIKPNFNLTGMLPGLLDSQGRLQCSSCHDPHKDTFESGVYDLPMWRHYTGNDITDYDQTCESCHINAPANISHN